METIFALSSGVPPCGVAVVRMSGPASRFVIETMCGALPERRASLRTIRHPRDGALIDEGLCLWFPGPASFTGEDCAELQVHGGPAVVRAVLAAIAGFEGCRMAEPGEFSRRAFANGRLDLTEAEGLADLIGAQTEAQRVQALNQVSGALRDRLEGWREEIVRMRALVEADFDFADEEDVPDSVADRVWQDAAVLAGEMRAFLDDGNRGEIIREGFQVVVMGKPNAGKSSLMNALAGRDVAIVTEEAGTTRDLIEVQLDIGGYAVTVVDTAGIRETEGIVEREGIRRAKERAARADLVLWLATGNEEADAAAAVGALAPVLVLRSKDDEGRFGEKGVSVRRSGGLDGLLAEIGRRVKDRVGGAEPVVVTRRRHRECLVRCAERLERAAMETSWGMDLRAELLREAGDWIGRVTGRIEVENLLDVIFREFCVGK